MRLEDFITNKDDVKQVLDVPHLSWGTESGEVLRINGVDDPVFLRLNGSLALRVVDRVERRVLTETGVFALNKDGSFMMEVVGVPTDCACVLSPVPLRIPFRYSAVGYSFVDASLNAKKPGFLYILPKKCLFRVPVVGLALSRKRMDSYESLRVELRGYGRLYLNVIPFNARRTYRSTLILKTVPDAFYRFESELVELLSFWRGLGLLEVCELAESSLFEVDSEETCLGGRSFLEGESL